MSLIRVSRGIPKYNIQIGPFIDALKHNPSAIISVSDYFEPSLVQFPQFQWVPINEGGKSWGYKPFFTVIKLLDFLCLELNLPLVYLCCSAGKHRSPLAGFCWLLSQPGATIESAATEFYGHFKESPQSMYDNDVRLGYLPDRLPEFFKNMRQFPNANYHDVLQSMNLYEQVRYVSGGPVVRL
jgi:hypothetical protein